MKEFSSLNGYAVKDTAARNDIELLKADVDVLEKMSSHVTPQMFGAVADGTADDTAAIQAALDTGKDVYMPRGNYLVIGPGLVVTKENQKIVFDGGAWIEAKTITSGYVLLVQSKFNKIYDLKIRLTDSDEKVNAIQIGGATELTPTETVDVSTSSTRAFVKENDVVSAYVSSATGCLEFFYGDNANVKITADWWEQNQDVTFTIVPTTGDSFTFGFSGAAPITSNQRTTISYTDLERLSSATKLEFKGTRYKTYLIAFNKGTQAVATDTNGFNCYLYAPTTTGTGLCGLQVNGAETRVLCGKFRGTKYGINIEAPDFYCENIYTEQCTDSGFRARSGSIEGHHIHSYNNKGKGFNLASINFSNFYGLYADKNIGDGVYIAENSGELNIFGGWSFYSGYEREDKAVFDWNLKNVKDLNLYGCRSSGGDDSKVASYNVDATSRVYMYGCMANLKPSVKDGAICKFMNCQDALKAYNTGSKSYKAGRQFVEPGASTVVTAYVDEILNEEKDIMAFDCMVQYRGTSTYTSGLAKYIMQASSAYETNITAIVEDEKIVVSTPTVAFTDNGATVVTIKITNNTTEQLQVNATLNKVGSIY